MRAGHFDQGLVIGMRDHLELAVGQAFPALGALEPARLAAKKIQKIHAFFVPEIEGSKPPKLIAAARR
jgi:hypothetical protein